METRKNKIAKLKKAVKKRKEAKKEKPFVEPNIIKRKERRGKYVAT